MRLEPLLVPERVIVIERDAASRLDRNALLRQLAETISASAAPEGIGITAEQLARGFEAREANRSTAMPEGIAFPHALLPGIRTTMLAIALVRGGIDFSETSTRNKRFATKPAGGTRCDLIFALIGPDTVPVEHVRALARLSRLVHPAPVRDRLRACRDAASLHAEFVKEDAAHVF